MAYGNYPDLSGVKKILVIKLRHLGDVLLTSPVFSQLKKELPQAQIDAYIYQEALPMLDGHAAISHIHLYDRKIKKLSFFQRITKELRLLYTLRKEKYDLVINLTEGDRGALVALFSKAPIRVGMDTAKKGFFRKKIYTHIVKHCPTPRHSVEKNLDALRRIGLFPKEQESELSFVLSSQVQKNVEDLLEKKGFLGKKTLLFHPSSRWRFKCYPLLSCQTLAKEIVKLGYGLVLTGGKEEYEILMNEAIAKELPSQSVLNLTGQISLKELGALMQKSQAVVCVDSVALHMASALHCKTLVLFGPTSEKNWGPWKNPLAKVVSDSISCRPCFMDGCGGSKVSQCLANLDPSLVLSELISLLKI